MLSRTVLDAIALTITAVWALSFLAQLVPFLNYRTDPQIHLIFGSLVGTAFALPKLLGSKGSSAETTAKPPGKHTKTRDE
jgi:hypothetical protein